MSKYRFRLRCPDQLTVKDTVIKRLLAKTVASYDQLFLPRIPQRERVHSIYMIEQSIAIFLVKVRKYFGIGFGSETMPAFFQIGPNFAVIIKLAVHHHD